MYRVERSMPSNRLIIDRTVPAIAIFKPSRFCTRLIHPVIIPIILIIIGKIKAQQNMKEIIPNTSEVIARLLFFFSFLPGHNSYIDYTTLKLRLNLLCSCDFHML